MPSLAHLTSLVVAQTRRPELTGITASALKSAILRAHHTDFFPRDLAEVSLTYALTPTAPLFQDFGNISTLAPSLRSIKTLYGVDAVTLRALEKLEYRELDDLHTTDGEQRQSVYTLLGDTLRCYFLARSGAAQLLYYRNPTFTPTDVTSWIAELYENEIANWAAGIVFARTGFAEMARDFQETHVKPFKELLVASHLLGNVN